MVASTEEISWQELPRPLIGGTEPVRIRVDQRRVKITRGLRDDLLILLALPFGLFMSLVVWVQQVDVRTGALKILFAFVSAMLALIALTSPLLLLLAPSLVLDKQSGRIWLRTRRLSKKGSLSIHRDEIERFILHTDPDDDEQHSLYGFRIYIKPKKRRQQLLLHLDKQMELDLFVEHVLGPTGIEMVERDSTSFQDP